MARERLEEKQKLEESKDITAQNSVLHIGAVASGDQVLKSAAHQTGLLAQEDGGL